MTATPDPTSSRRTRPKKVLVAAHVVLLVLLVGVASGVGPAAGATVPIPQGGQTNALSPAGAFTPGTPYASGQTVNVDVGPSILPPLLNVGILECAAPNGVLPTNPTQCDPNTISADTIIPAADGSFHYHGLYQVYATPSVALGESPTKTPVCGNTLATECVLGIFQNYNSFTAPHIFSLPFYIQKTDALETGTVSPGDGSPPAVPASPSATDSTVTAGPTTAVANGSDTSQVTVTVKGISGSSKVPISGATVKLAGGIGSLSSITPTSAVTDSSGVVTFIVKDVHAESVTYTATAGTTTIVQTAVVAFAAPAPSPNSLIAASPTTVANGGTSTVTVTVNDQAPSPRPINGVTVSLAGNAGTTPVITPTSGLTDAQGIATFTVSDTAVEPVILTATAGTVALTANVTVTFGTLDVSSSASTVVATPTTTPVGPAGSNVKVTLLTAVGAHPVPLKAVALTAGAGSSAVITPSTLTTDQNGTATFTVSDTVVESVVFSARDTTDNIPIVQTATVQFQAVAPPSISPTLSSVTLNPSKVPADGTAGITVFVTVLKSDQKPAVGVVVHVTPTTPNSNLLVTPIRPAGSQVDGATGTDGRASSVLLDTVAETVPLTVTVTDPNQSTVTVVLAPSGGIPPAIFTPGPVDGGLSTVTVSPSAVPADGTTASTVTVTVLDHFLNPVVGKTLRLDQGAGNSVITPASAISNAAGVATFTVTSTHNERVTYDAVDVGDGNLVLTPTATVTFGTPPPTLPSPTGSTIVTDYTSVPADGKTAATVSVLLYDAFGLPVAGRSVALTAASGTPGIAPATATSDPSGTAKFSVTNTTVQAVTLTAKDTTDNVTLLQALTIGFTAPGASSGGSHGLNAPIVGTAPAPGGFGYWMVGSDGGIFNFGSAGFYGSTGSLTLNKPIVGMAASPSGKGYWFVAADGGTFAFGDAAFFGSTGSLTLNKPIVGMASSPSGKGYWLVAADGGIFAFGDAGFFGSTGSLTLNKPIVGMAATPTGLGYWLVAADGGIFNFGNAGFFGSTGSLTLNRPIVGMAASSDGHGYWLVASDGGIFNFGSAGFYGSTGSLTLNKPIVGMAALPGNTGYWLAASDGGIFAINAQYYGSAA